MDTKSKNSKLAPKIILFIMVISLGMTALYFNLTSISMHNIYDGEFYESSEVNSYINGEVNNMYIMVDTYYDEYNQKNGYFPKDENIKFMVINNKTNSMYTNTEYKVMSDFKNKEKGYVQIEGENYTFNTKINNKVFTIGERTSGKIKDENYKSQFTNNVDLNVISETKQKENIGGEVLQADDISVYAVIAEVPKAEGELRQHYLKYTSVNNIKKNISIISIIGLIVFILSIVISKVKGYKYINEENKMYKIYSNIAIELKVAIISILFIMDNSMDLYYFKETLDGMKYSMEPIVFISNIILKVMYIIMIYILIKNIKDKSIFNNSIVVKIFNFSRQGLRSILVASKKIGLIKKILLIFISILVINIVLFFIVVVVGSAIIGEDEMLLVVIGVISFILFTAYIISKLTYLNEIMEGVKKIESGDINYKIEVKGNDSFTLLAENINNIGNGLDNAIEERMKSEKMKSELITNVSHDLKTPLTSILNYVDLLMKEEVKPEYLNDYIKILDKKSKRLKILIEDLFEAAKATSGSVELNIEKIQLNQLLTQSIAEMEGKINEAKLDMKFNFPENKVYINADGKKLFRVFENLISNIVKYSLNGTRVYVEMSTDDEYAYINFKNISAYELNFDDGEITERFKRGDVSRSEEGSGLGLSIAKGLVELQGGEFTIQTDGDLFKAIVKLRLSKE